MMNERRCACGRHRTVGACLGAQRWRRTAPYPTKPCARGGCTGLVTGKGPKTLAKKAFCSHRCVALDRIARGTFLTYRPTTEERRRGGRMSGRIAAARRRREAMIRAATEAVKLLPRDIVDVLTPHQLQRLKVAIARVWRTAKQVGYHASWADRRRAASRARASAA